MDEFDFVIDDLIADDFFIALNNVTPKEETEEE